MVACPFETLIAFSLISGSFIQSGQGFAILLIFFKNSYVYALYFIVAAIVIVCISFILNSALNYVYFCILRKI